jgi:hypothetical protein
LEPRRVILISGGGWREERHEGMGQGNLVRLRSEGNALKG